MSVELQSESGLPYGQNIHFAYDIDAGDLIYVHPTFQWLCPSSEVPDAIADFILKINGDELPLLSQLFNEYIEGKVQDFVTFSVQFDNGLRWLRITPFNVYQNGRKLIIGSVSDITAEVVSSQTVVKYADKKNSILHMLAHDLRGPLEVGKSLMNSMAVQLTDPLMQDKTSNIVSILEHAISMINDLVTREFLETTEVMLSKRRIDLVRKLNSYIEECRRSSSIAYRTFNFSSNAPSIFIQLDEGKFMQVMNNLISNALKFTLPGGSISIELFDKGTEVQLLFTDNGIGIPAALMPSLFDKFTSSSRPGIMGEPTVGLGMSIIKTIITWHKGTIVCESEENKGTSFLISLPKT